MDWYPNALKDYFGPGGHMCHREYWMFVLINIIFIFVLDILGRTFGWERVGGEGILTTIYGALVSIPRWVVWLRCLYDADHLAWRLLVLLIPVVDWPMIIISNCQNGIQRSGHFGPDPKQLS